MNEAEVRDEIAAEAERIRTDGSLPPGFEEKVAATFAAIAADPAALEKEAATGGAPPPAGPSGMLQSLKTKAKARVGPKARVLQRTSRQKTENLLDTIATRRLVLSDRAISGASKFVPGRAALRLLGVGRPPALLLPPALQATESGRLADDSLDSFLLAALGDLPAGPVLLVDGGEDELRRRVGSVVTLAEGGRSAGGFASLSTWKSRSLAAVVLLAVGLDGPGARLLVSLLASRLQPGAAVVILSEEPGWREETDPVEADLSAGHPLNAVTWLYLFASCGLEGGKLQGSADGSAYAVTARLPA